MDYLAIVNMLYLGLIGCVFVTWGSNAPSRIYGLLSLALAVANATKLDGLIH